MVESGTLDRLYTGLPVLIVPKLAKVTPEALALVWDRFQQDMFDFAPLLLDYWPARFAGRPTGRLQMRWAAFQQTPLAEIAAAFRRPE